MADGVRSPLGKLLGREWHRDTVYGVAGRSYVDSEMSDDPWISSHLELRGEDGEICAATAGSSRSARRGEPRRRHAGDGRRPADIAIKPLMQTTPTQRREEFGLSGELRAPTSALLPMGGAVSNVAGANWALIGDAAGCVNPLNGEGIDYGLETGRFVAEAWPRDERPRQAWPRRCCASTTARRSPSPAGSRAWPPSPGASRRWARRGCARTG